MPGSHLIEGRWEDILLNNADQLAGRLVKVYIQDDDSFANSDISETLDEAIERVSHRSAEQISRTRDRIFAASPRPRELPPGQTVFDAVMGHWPGEETDAEIDAALKKLS